MKVILTNMTDQPVIVKLPPMPQFFSDDPLFQGGASMLLPQVTAEWIAQTEAGLPPGVTLEIVDETKLP